MYLIEVFFKNQHVENSQRQISLLNQIIDQWRYNGQIIGREIPLFLAEQEQQKGFAMRVICPEQQSLLPEYNNPEVQACLEQAEKSGLFFHSFQIVADDFNSDSTDDSERPNWQVLYTTYLQSCSPLHNGDNLAPIPLYRQFQAIPHLAMDIIKWQENWQAYDQLQMNAAGLEQQAIQQISDINSQLSKHGYYLAREIEKHSMIPTYYYLYRVGGESLQQELQRCCPICQKQWKLAQPIFDLFHFKCDDCRLVSNISWNFL